MLPRLMKWMLPLLLTVRLATALILLFLGEGPRPAQAYSGDLGQEERRRDLNINA